MKTIIFVNILTLCIILLSANNALEFNGSSSKIVVSDTQEEFPVLFTDLDNSSFTFEFWLLIHADTQNASRIIDIRHSGVEFVSIIYYNQKLCCNVRSPDNSASRNESNIIETDNWYYVVLRWNHDSGESELLINNEVQNSSSIDISTGYDNHFYIGTKTSSGSYFQGKIDDFRIWSGVRANYQLRDTFQEELTGGESGLYLYYNLDEIQAGSTIEDLTENDFDGECTSLDDSSIVLADAWLDGYKCLQFDGINDFLSIKNSIELNSSNYTIIMWFMADNYNSDQYLFSKGSDGYYLKIDSSEQLDFNGFTTASLSLDPGRWYNIAAVKQGIDQRLYLNGKEQELTGADTAGLNSDPLDIGNREGNYFTGKIDDIQIYNTALTAEELCDLLYSNYLDNPGLVSWFDCNRIDGSILYDKKGSLQAYMEGVDSGIDTGYSTNWIKDDLQSWSANEFTDKYLTIVDDYYFQTRKIVSNTSELILVIDEFLPSLAYEGNLYCISDLIRTSSDLAYPRNNTENYQNSVASIWNTHPEAYCGGLSVSAEQFSPATLLEVGNNGLTGISYNYLGSGAIDYRLARIWELVLGDNINTVEIAFDVSAIQGQAISLGSVSNYQLLHTETEGDFEVVTTGLSASIIENEIVFSGVALDDLCGYITLGARNDAPLPVTLASFTGNWTGSMCSLNWQTLSEINNCGWNAYRGEDASTQFQVNTELIPGAGTTTGVSSYTFQDEYEAIPGSIYYYWLESVSLLGASDQYGPIVIEVPAENESESPPIPVVYGLSCYPNPFNPNTRICFCVPEAGYYNLVIFNLKGQKVQMIFSNEYLQDNQDMYFEWDGRNISGRKSASGTYVVHLKGKRADYYKKITLLS
jgi:Concanavalin A-like lectin/glucanases superfamily